MDYNGYRIQALDTFSMVKIMPKGSGSIPKPLTGLFTTKKLAKQAIDTYLSSLITNKKRKPKNAEKESIPTD